MSICLVKALLCVFPGIVGLLMFVESLNAIRKLKKGAPALAPPARLSPCAGIQMRFRTSAFIFPPFRLWLSACSSYSWPRIMGVGGVLSWCPR